MLSDFVRVMPRAVLMVGLSVVLGALFSSSGRAMSDAPSQLDSADVLDLVLKGLGGRDLIAGLNAIAMDTDRKSFIKGQGLEPGSGIMSVQAIKSRITHDITGNRWRSDMVIEIIGGEQMFRTELLDGDVGYTIGTADPIGALSDNVNAMSADVVSSTMKTERLLNPHILVKGILDGSLSASLMDAGQNETEGRLFTEDEILPITVARERQSGKRTLIGNAAWLERLQGTQYYDVSVTDYETDEEWLDRWHDGKDVHPSTHIQLQLDGDDNPITLYIDRVTGRVSKLQTLQWDVIYGDIPVWVTFQDYQTFGDIVLPTLVKLSYGGAPRLEETRSTAMVNPKIDEAYFSVPEDKAYEPDLEVAARGRLVSQSMLAFGFAGVGRPTIGSVEIDTGVYLVYAAPIDAVYTMVVEQENGIVVIEPGMNDLKGEEVIDWINQRFPGKPITHLMISHFHNDHSGGLRPYVAAGAALVVHEEGTDFYKAQVNRPKSQIAPDALDRAPVDVEIISIPADGTYRMDDPERPIVFYPVEIAHTSDMILAVVENKGILYSSDFYVSAIARMLRAGLDRPPGTPDTRTPFHAAVSLAKAIDKHKLDVPVMIGAHDKDTVSYAEFRAYLDARD
ncbi:MAG: MBL fold metallo-hydrolase [Rhodospirillaceae bacterium]|nr:MBL fold metallo-hydrolase [Rhodospirillaceae bacterium]